MARTNIDVQGVLNSSWQVNAAKSTASGVRGDLDWMRGQISSAILNRNNLRERLRNVSVNISNVESRMNRIRTTAENGANRFYNTDRTVITWKRELQKNIQKNVSNSNGWNTGATVVSKQANKKEKVEKKSSLWSWSDTWKLAESAGIVGTLASTIGGAITGGVSVKSGLKFAKSTAKVVEKISKAVPKSGASFDWKKLFGLEAVITSETPKSLWGALGNEVQKLNFGSAKTVSDKIAVGAKWAGHALTAITTTYENFTDTKENNSTGRKIAESIGETAVKIGEGILIGAGVTAAFAAAGVVGAPAVVVGAVTVGVTWAVDKVCEAISGKNVAELVSDTVLDTGEKVIKGIGKGAKAVKDKVTGWWKKAFG